MRILALFLLLSALLLLGCTNTGNQALTGRVVQVTVLGETPSTEPSVEASPTPTLVASASPEPTFKATIAASVAPKRMEVDEELLRKWEKRIYEYTNGERNRFSIPYLSWDGNLAEVARKYSKRMADEGFFSHNDSQGDDVFNRMREDGIYYFRYGGENLLKFTEKLKNGTILEAEDVPGVAVYDWMESEGHRMNILFPAYTDLGVGAYQGADGWLYFTQVFIRKSVCGYKGGPCCGSYAGTCDYIGLTCSSSKVCVKDPNEEFEEGQYGVYGATKMNAFSVYTLGYVGEVNEEAMGTNTIWFASDRELELHLLDAEERRLFIHREFASNPVIKGKNGTFVLDVEEKFDPNLQTYKGFVLFNPDENKEAKVYFGVAYGDHMQWIDRAKAKYAADTNST